MTDSASRGSLSFRFQPTRGDLYRLLLGEAYRSPLRLLLNAAFPVAGLAILGLVLSERRAPTALEMLLIALALCFTPLLTALIVARTGRDHPMLRGEVAYGFSAERIESVGESFRSEVDWDHISRVRETSRYLIFYVSAFPALFLPVRLVQAAGRLEPLRALIREKKGASARLRGEPRG